MGSTHPRHHVALRAAVTGAASRTVALMLVFPMLGQVCTAWPYSDVDLVRRHAMCITCLNALCRPEALL